MTSDQPREVTTLRRLHELMSRVNAGEDLAAVLQSLVDGVADVTGFAVAAVSYLHPDRHLEVVSVAGDDLARDELLGIRTPIEVVVDEFALADDWGLLKFIPHERLDGETPRGWIPDVRPLDSEDAWHPEDALLAPLSAPTGEMVGMLSVDLPRDGRRPDQFSRDALEMYAVQAGIAISNAQQRERLREQLRLAGVAREVAQRAGGELDLGRVVDSSVGPLVEGLGLVGLWVRAFDGEGEMPGRGRGAAYPPGGPAPADHLLDLARGLAEPCWTARRAVLLQNSSSAAGADASRTDLGWAGLDPADVDRVFDAVRHTGSRTLLLVPMGAGPQCLGYLILGRDADPSSWTAQEVATALEVGRDLGRAVLHARLYERERELVDELRQLDVYKTEMVSTLAHELKSPLTAIVGHLELLETADDEERARRSTRVIGRGAQRLTELVDDLMLLSKVADPDRDFTPAPVDLAEIVVSAADMLGALADRQTTRVVLEGVTEKVTAWGMAAELDRLVCNLLGNAVKFSPSGGTVTCSLRTDGDDVVLTCRDEGIGVTEEDQALLFSEFFRSSNPVALEIPGTGLGLTIVKRIVERHRGTIAVESSLGQGSTFTVTLPGAAA